MKQQQTEAIGAGEPVAAYTVWIRPQVDRLIAGGAEAGPAGDVDRADTLS